MVETNGVDIEKLTGLQTKALLASLSIGTWSGRKYDREATETVADEYQASSDCGRFNKLLVEHKTILNLYRVAAQARRFHNIYSLPWNDAGTRLLPTKAYMEYVEGINKHARQFWLAVDEFFVAYEQLITDSKDRLGHLWKREDYPDVADLRSKFHFDVYFSFLPDPQSDIRVGLSEVEEQKVKESTIQQFKDVYEKTNRDLWMRMRTVVSRIFERLGDPDKIFKKGTFENIDQLEGFVDKLNITGNQEIKDTMDQIKQELTAYEPQEIRDDLKKREEVHNKAKDILDKISAFI